LSYIITAVAAVAVAALPRTTRTGSNGDSII
jgi:hypothetical protein